MASILSILILFVRNKGVGFFLLNGQNPLSATKVICWYSLKTWRKWVLISSKLKFNFESSTWTVEVILTRSPCPGLLDFLRNLFYKKNLKHGRSMGSDDIALNFLKKLDSIDILIFHVSNLNTRVLDSPTHPHQFDANWEDLMCEWPLKQAGLVFA